MTTTIFDLSAIDRIERDVINLQNSVNAVLTQDNNNAASIAVVGQAISVVGKTLTDFITALGGGDQPSIDAVTASLEQMRETLAAAVARDHSLGE